MIATALVIIVAMALAVTIALIVRGGLLPGSATGEDLVALHLPAMRNLLDETQQDFLRERLPTREFKRLQRKRNRALLVYVKRIASNSAVLMRVAHAAAQSQDGETAAAGRELLQSAMSTRIHALKAIVILSIGVALPSTARELGTIVSRYSSSKDRYATLGRMTGHKVSEA